jgi:hypothetical protein
MNLTDPRRAALCAASLMLLAAPGVALMATAADASPAADGCPSGTLTYTWPDLQSLGFTDESFFQTVDANADGLVCAKPLSAQQQKKFCATHECTVSVIFGFRDNTNGPGS